MLCIGYGEAEADEGSLSAETDPSSVSPPLRDHSRCEALIRDDPTDEFVPGNARWQVGPSYRLRRSTARSR
jgi:hypothetical protein